MLNLFLYSRSHDESHVFHLVNDLIYVAYERCVSLACLGCYACVVHSLRLPSPLYRRMVHVRLRAIRGPSVATNECEDVTHHREEQYVFLYYESDMTWFTNQVQVWNNPPQRGSISRDSPRRGLLKDRPVWIRRRNASRTSRRCCSCDRRYPSNECCDTSARLSKRCWVIQLRHCAKKLAPDLASVNWENFGILLKNPTISRARLVPCSENFRFYVSDFADLTRV